ncbi:hypothetical protein KL930_001879 [Ogataea haglerorum]|uniref:Cyclin N-terminal domain-containing protein n=1 Tax=Ogataea haglerorum TaxID=1937702 RepID=A0AAN6DAN4_9ASCO|nr:hypothetical protein KL915_001935 [Ogataea haglerorum]KAG7699489.1 hypothetical protein KL951_001206 [Ogataea haglerorum]KAG7708439.1 hypothetical protein KL914_002165 [Ogataea haglerorum]KAG7710533.1 hypothetical protein KL950_001446 [Ogataea haglerorum]KAG7721155.1 hypothetical protein KL913_000891 [Ogataea haglerorum]
MGGPALDQLLTPEESRRSSKLRVRVDCRERDVLATLSLLCVIILQECFRTSANLHRFVAEVLKRSRSSNPVLHVTMYYLLEVYAQRQQQLYLYPGLSSVTCPKRCFLTCLILASKYLQDQNYTLTTWSKITGLSVDELQTNERKILDLLRYKLHIKESEYKRLCGFMRGCEKRLAADKTGPAASCLLTPPSSPRECRDDEFLGWRATQSPDSTLGVETRTALARAIEQFVEFHATEHDAAGHDIALI